MMRYEKESDPFEWAVSFDSFAKKCLSDREHQPLIDYQKHGEAALKSVPTTDHYLPMLYIAAMQSEEEPLEFFHESIQHGSVSMRCFRVGK